MCRARCVWLWMMDCFADLFCYLGAVWSSIYADVWGCLWPTLDILLSCMAMGMAFFELWMASCFSWHNMLHTCTLHLDAFALPL